ncbi:MAG: N-acetylglucosamine-6-phosphate deacetylase [Clostridia bacterium]|nr:N-acetylglucosamine-6-phosphate deacetylase [Clostridia bacterium]
MKAIVNGRIVTPWEIVPDQALLFDGKIRGVAAREQIPHGAEVLDARGGYVLPGLIDIHIHGYLGQDASDGSYEGLCQMARGIAANGVTGFLPTTMTVSYGELREAFAQIRKLMADSLAPDWNGARALGVNAEGPFINPVRKGAQSGEHIREGDAAFLREYADIIRVFTIAPEMPGNLACIREIASSGMLIAMGHTDANYVQALAGLEAGVRHMTHTFNGQGPLNHRDPGAVGVALTDERVSCELIADTVHIHPGMFRLLARAKGDKLILITDCTRAGGLGDGEYTLGGQTIYVKGTECRLADGTLAGSVMPFNQALRNMRRNTDLPLHEVVRMATLNPARAIGVDGEKGSLEAGKDADIAIVDEEMRVQRTLLGGRTIFDSAK